MSLDAIDAAAAGEPATAPFDFDALFRARYGPISRVIARVLGDTTRAEELAVEAFLRLWKTTTAHGEKAEGWIYRTGVRLALDELRRQTRRQRYESLFPFVRSTLTPEQIRAQTEERGRVRFVLSRLRRRDAELLVLRNEDLTYQELAATLGVNPASVGTWLARARRAFRQEYLTRYGDNDAAR